MSNQRRTKKQVASDKAALKRLQKSGTYSGKVDLRKAPTRYQLKKIEELKAAARAKRAKPDQVPGAKITRKKLSAKQLEELQAPKHKLTTYALPFLRKGRDEPEWRRFTFTQMKKFLAEYQPDEEAASEWASYAVQEHWEFDTRGEATAMRKDVNVYFSGVRISEPKGEIKKRVSRKRAKK